MSVVIAQILLSYAPSLISLRVCVQEPIPLTEIGVGMACRATPRPQQLYRETLSQKTKKQENHGPRSQLLKHKWPTTRTFFTLHQENTSREAGKDPWLKNPLLKNHPNPRPSMAANLLWEFVDGEDKTTVFRICCKILWWTLYKANEKCRIPAFSSSVNYEWSEKQTFPGLRVDHSAVDSDTCFAHFVSPLCGIDLSCPICSHKLISTGRVCVSKTAR